MLRHSVTEEIFGKHVANVGPSHVIETRLKLMSETPKKLCLGDNQNKTKQQQHAFSLAWTHF